MYESRMSNNHAKSANYGKAWILHAIFVLFAWQKAKIF